MGNKTVYIGFIFQAIGLIVWPVSFNQFGEACDETGQYACGKSCAGTAEFDYFTICDPWEFGLHFILACVGVGVQMVASIIYGCVEYEP